MCGWSAARTWRAWPKPTSAAKRRRRRGGAGRDRAVLRRAGRQAHRHRRARLHALSVPGQHLPRGWRPGRSTGSTRPRRSRGARCRCLTPSSPADPGQQPDRAIFTSGNPDFPTRRLMQGFGLSLLTVTGTGNDHQRDGVVHDSMPEREGASQCLPNRKPSRRRPAPRSRPNAATPRRASSRARRRDVRIDEREAARGIRRDQAQGPAGEEVGLGD